MVWKIWTKIYCSARNLLVHHSSLSHTTYVETNKYFRPNLLEKIFSVNKYLLYVLSGDMNQY